ncbi:Putative Ferritin-like superfamily [Septoria linicola]|uniref:Ferritin-like superfamily n=1 Tax=Septoria linicola TaxID=215465 RepID=A0A9Q9B467_9PEZI|nr:putative Ferritin-like superfamily [Septoria linicola]USW58628.1 Putative Ferritin-like superfamily [Septoria linicola]
MHATLIASLAAMAAAAPLVERQAAPPPSGVDDATILNYALSLEHLENVFYQEALAKFSEEDFKKAGLGSSFYNNLQQISFDEKTHVAFLEAGLTAAGATPVKQCEYAFGVTDVQSFLATANILEGVGVSAYLGAAKYVKSPDYLTAAGSILTVESRHSAYIRDNQNPQKSPFPSPFDTPLEFSEVFSLAALFIKSCPDAPEGTLGLPFKAFPAITVSPASVAKSGDKLTLTCAKEVDAKSAYFITSNGPVAAAITGSGTTYEVVVPEIGVPNLKPGTINAGQGYIVLTKSADKPSDDNIVAGPAVVDFADNATGRAPDSKGEGYGKPSGYAPAPSHPAPAPYQPSHPTQPEAPKYSPKEPEHPKTYEPEHKPTATTYKAPEHPTSYPTEHATTYETHPAPTYPVHHETKTYESHAEYPTTTPCPSETPAYHY